jgi:hypothetical protein
LPATFQSGEIASNYYGNGFLIEQHDLLEESQFVYLVAVSYFSAPNSRIFKVINVTQNERCHSLNEDSYYVVSPEDQVAVSFICNSYL